MTDQKSGSTRQRVSRANDDAATLQAMVEGLDLDDHQKAIVMDRWLDQTNWFSNKASHAKRRSTQFRVLIIVGGVLLPVLATLPNTAPVGVADWGTPLVSFLVAATAGLEGFFKYTELHYQYRESAEMLKIEGWSFFGLSGEYGRYRTHKDAFEKFSERTEDVIRRDVRAVVSQERVEAKQAD